MPDGGSEFGARSGTGFGVSRYRRPTQDTRKATIDQVMAAEQVDNVNRESRAAHRVPERLLCHGRTTECVAPQRKLMSPTYRKSIHQNDMFTLLRPDRQII